MNDSRILQASTAARAAAADEARSLIDDIENSGPLVPFPESHYLSKARACFNEGIEWLQKAYTPGDDAA
jgi:hypothetical protein